MSKIDFLGFGGLDEKQNPCYSLTIDGDIYILNCGISLPTSTSLGIKKIIPDYSWIINNKNAIKGIFIGNATYINFGGLQYLYRLLPNIPIYTNDISASIIITYFKNLFYNTNNNLNLNIRVLEPMKANQIGKASVIMFKVSSYTPHSTGFVFNTKDGAIIYIDDFVLNSSIGDLFPNDYLKVAQAFSTRCLALIVGSGLVGESTGFTYPNAHIIKYFIGILQEHIDSRVLVSCYDFEIYRMLSLISACASMGRPICIYGKNFFYTFKHLQETKKLFIKNLKIINDSQLEQNPNAVVLIVDSLEKYFVKLQKIINGEDPKVQLQETDNFVYANNTLFGYEKAEANLIDNLYRSNINQIYKLPKTILPLKASNEDHKFIINCFKPKYIIPVSGLHMSFEAYKKCAWSMGINKNSVLVLDNGDKVTFENTQLLPTKKFIKLTPQFINSQGSLDGETSSMFERDQMKETGVVLANLLLSNQTKQIIKFNFDAVGVLNITDQIKETLSKLNEEFVKSLNEYAKTQLEAKTFDIKEYKLFVRKIVGKQFDKKFNKKPLVITTIIFSK